MSPHWTSTDLHSTIHSSCVQGLLGSNCVTNFSRYMLGQELFSLCSTSAALQRIDMTLANDDEQGNPSSSTDDPYSFQLWPLTKEITRTELLTLQSSHRLCPVPAYDLENNLLHPSTYQRCLQGAIVEIHFTLSHWSIATAKRDVYGGLIQLIRILVPVVPSSTVGKKRKLPLHLDIDDSPSKKSALT